MSIQTEDVSRSQVESVTSNWPDKPSDLAGQLMDQYGVPDEVTSQRLLWHDAGEWKRVHVYRDGTPHDFPKEHVDHLRQTIDYPIDPRDAEALLEFDGSNVLWRTRGELSADCHKETMNFLTINLAHDVLTGERTVEEAREAFAETAVKATMGLEPDYTTGLQFEVPAGDQGDPDEEIVTETLKEDVKEAVGIDEGGE